MIKWYVLKRNHICTLTIFTFADLLKHIQKKHPEKTYAVCSKISKAHPERRGIAEHFCGSNTLPLLIKLEKLIQISVLVFIGEAPYTGERCTTNLNLGEA